jgi:cell division protein FtsA
MAEVTVGSLIANISCGRLKSETFSASVPVGGAVTEQDVQRVLGEGGAHSVSDGRMVLHSLPIGYSLDANRGIDDPTGMLGELLGVDMHVVTADEAPLRNLELAINRCHLELETVVATPYAAGLASLVDDEAQLGVACIDMGGGTTTLSVFHNREFIHADAIAIGGQHVTLDIARGLSTNMVDAERLKARHGSALPSSSDEKDILTIPPSAKTSATTPIQCRARR